MSDLDIAGLGKAAIRVIDSVENACTGLTKTWQIRRVAKAEADAKKTHANADAEIRTIEAETSIAINALHDQQSKNIEQIALKAIELEPESNSEEPVDPDWTMKFIDDAKNTSNEEVQELWARVLAGEMSHPGSFSKRTLSILNDISTKEAVIFSNIIQSGFTDLFEKESINLITTYKQIWALAQPTHKHSESKTTTFMHSHLFRYERSDLVSLASLGLMESIPDPFTHTRKLSYIQWTTIGSDDYSISLKYNKDSRKPNYIEIGSLKLTKYGAELASIVDKSTQPEILDEVIKYFELLRYIVTKGYEYLENDDTDDDLDISFDDLIAEVDSDIVEPKVKDYQGD